MPRNLLFLYLMELCAGAARGAYLVCIGWTTLIVSGDVAIVGQVFIVAMLTVMFAGPVAGVIIDRNNRKHLAIVAHLGIAVALTSLGAAIAADSPVSLLWFFLTVILVTIFRNLYQGSHDGLIHANVCSEQIAPMVARFRGTHLLATTIGTVLTGFIIEWNSPTAGFLFAAALSLLLILAVFFVKGFKSKDNAVGFSGFVKDFSGGLALFRDNQTLRVLTLLAGVALPVGQLSNAILSSFIRDDLNRGSDVFGFVDAAWPIGGMAAAALLSIGLKKLTARNMEYVFSLMAGLSTIIFSFCSTVLALAFVHAAMGFTVWMCRIVIDGRVLQICSEHTVGRTRVYIEVMFSFGAMVMCFSPTLIKLPATSDYFLYWGIAVTLVSGLLWLRQSRPSG
ncbi:MAG: hypothetical protein ACI9LO_001543 [Planctomycetota bacterium]|jgi:hypothetical protein